MENPSEYRPRAASDPTYVSPYPERPSNYRVTFVNNTTSTPLEPSRRESKPRDLGVSSKSAASLRMTLDSSMLNVKGRCDEISRYLSDMNKALAAGNGEDLLRQLVEVFPELVSGLFGLPVAASTSTNSGNLNATTASYASSIGSTRAWMDSAGTLEEYEALYQLLHAKGALFSVMMQHSGGPQAPLYPFPISCLPPDAFSFVQSGMGTSVNVTAAAGPIGGVDPIQKFLSLRLNRARHVGLSLTLLEYFLFGFCWYCSSQGESVETSNRFSSNNSTTSAASFKSQINVLYTCLVRQFGMVLLEADASHEVSLSKYGRGSGGLGNSGGDGQEQGYFRTFVCAASMFWLQQNPAQFFYSVCAGIASQTHKKDLFVLRPRHVAPKFLMLNALHDLLTLLMHVSGDPSTVFASTHEGAQYQYHYQAYSQDPVIGPFSSAVGRIAGSLWRDVVQDNLYRMLKLGLMFSTQMWPYLVTLWRLVLSPWDHVAPPEAYLALAPIHQRYLSSLIEAERRPLFAGASGADKKLEDFPFSTLLVCPYNPASLGSPFVIPKKAGSSSSSRSSAQAAGALISNFSLSSIFFSEPGSSSSNSVTTRSIGGVTVTSTAPANWDWFNFFDPSASIGMSGSSPSYLAAKEAKAASGLNQSVLDSQRMDRRAYIVINYMLYAPMLRLWIDGLSSVLVEQMQPLTQPLLVSISELFGIYGTSSILTVLRELENSIHQPMDRFSDIRVEFEKRTMMERRMVLEHIPTSPAPNAFSDPNLVRMAVSIAKEANQFARLAQSFNRDAPDSAKYVTDLCRDLEVIFGLSKADLDAQLADSLNQKGESLSKSASQKGGPDAARAGPMARLTDEQRSMLRNGRMVMDRAQIAYTGDVWDRPVSSRESWIALWVLYRLSLLFGLAERRSGATRTYLNLRPLGAKVVLWSVVLLVVAVFLVRALGNISFASWFEFEEDPE